ncbi:MAG: arginine deiminase-related protein, partial [Pseudomonadota bacterium]
DVIDYSGLETDGLALEGTGAMVLDHVGRVAYTAQSNRADPVILERFCTNFNFEPMVFQAEDRAGSAIYHTNVMMTVGTDFALVCLDMIVDSQRRAEVVRRLEESGRDVIALSHEQIAGFAGNALELKGHNGLVLALSARAEQSLTADQQTRIRQSAALLPISIPTIELAGGSVRCMLAGVHLSQR